MNPEVRDLAAYHADDTHESQSRLKVLDESASLYEATFLTRTIRDKDTPDKLLGRCLHAKVLQPDLFTRLCPIMPDYHLDGCNVTDKGKPSTSKSTKYYQDRKHEFEQDNAGRDIIDADDLVQLRDMANAIWRHGDAHAILSSSEDNEVVHRWHDRINRRCMMDAPRPGIGVIADIKTVTGPPTTLNFARNAARWRHWIQAPWYLDAAADLYGPGEYRFLFICVNKLPPYQVAIHELDDAETAGGDVPDLVWAENRTEELVTELIRRRETGDWTDSWQRGINKVPLPKFLRSTFYDVEE